MRRTQRHHALLLAALALAAAGCNRGPDKSAAPAAAQAPSTAAPRPSDAVAAVSLGDVAPPIKVGFEIVTRPVVGERSTVALTLTSDSVLPGARVEISSPGAQVDPDSASIQLVDLRPDSPVRKDISITPSSAGLTEVVVQLSIPKDGGVQQGSYAIPLLVSDVGSDKSNPAPAGDHGDPKPQ